MTVSTPHLAAGRHIVTGRRPRLLPIAFLLYGIGYLLLLLGADVSDQTRSFVANVGYVPLAILSALLAGALSRLPGLPARQRHAWRLMTVACALTAAADIIWAIEDRGLGHDPSQSILANIGYLLYYPAMLAGLLHFPQAFRSRRDAWKFGIDVATVTVGGAMVVCHFVIMPALAATETSRFAHTVSLAYMAGDLLLLVGIAAVLLRCPRGPRRRPMVLVAASASAMLVADILWAHLSPTGSVHAGNLQAAAYIVQYVLFAMALAEERVRLSRMAPDDADSALRPFTTLSYAAVVAGYAVVIDVALRSKTADLATLVLGGVALAGLVLIRQIVAVRENIRLQRERTLLASETRFKSLIQHASDVVSIIDADGTITFASPSAVRTLGYPTATLLGRSFLELVHPDDHGDAAGRLRESKVDAQRVITANWRLRRRDGTFVQTENVCTNLTADENVRGLVLTSRDVSERFALEAQLRHQAFHDPLTGLANRALFQDRVQHALSRRRGDLDRLGVLFVDLDEFKNVNDRLGHTTGDAVLRAAAQRLISCLRAFDTAARLGGDEFAVLIDDDRGEEAVTSVADRIVRMFLEPFMVDGREVIASCSVGVALAARDQTAEDLLRNADLAMYLAKKRGRAQTALFEPAMHAAVLNRLELQEDLRHAQERSELWVAYQPIHSLETQELIGAEALLRWTHPTRGPIPPSAFVPIAEETGLIVPIGRWVLQRACDDARGWQVRQPQPTPLRVSVNLSGRQLPEPSLIDDVRLALHTSGLSPRSLVLEFTETMLLQHTDHALAVMRRLKSQGVQLAIDDFGTGYSSLSYLQRLPIDILKIDRAFVEQIEGDRSASALTRAIIALGQTMSLHTIAEGIESAQQAEQLRALGCDFGQGFFYGIPMASSDLEAYIQRWRVITAA